MVNFMEAIKRPLKTDLMTIVLGSVFMGLHVLGGLLVTVFGGIIGGLLALLSVLAHGLGIEASRRTIRNDHSMPAFDDYVDLFFSGLMVWVIGVLYFLPAMIVVGLGVANSFPLIFSVFNNAVWQPVNALQGMLLLIFHGALYGLVALVLAILATIMLPIAVQLYAKNKQLGDAFKFSDILNVAATKEYWMSWVVLAAYGIVLTGVSIILSLLSLGVLLVPAFGVSGYLWWMTWYTLFADVTHQKMGTHHSPGKRNSSNSKAPSRKGRFASKKR